MEGRSKKVGIRFIGNKQRLLPFIVERVRQVTNQRGGVIADLFTGTASVARAFKREGYQIIANDLLAASTVFATAGLLVSQSPAFTDLLREEPLTPGVRRLFADPVDTVLAYLNDIEGCEDFFYCNYAPTGSVTTGVTRQYFTDDNARKIDAIRLTIRRWWNGNLINASERAFLLSSLMLASNDVANVAGTYGFFLSTWYDRALQPLRLTRPQITPGRTDHSIYREDANTLASRIEADVVYLDPPYTKRQYSAYYHILETLAEDDEPLVWGRTGLRPRQAGEWASRYCYKREALHALEELVDVLQCRHIFVSYSSDGHIAHDRVIATLERRGPVQSWSVPLARYKSNSRGTDRDALRERLYSVRCSN